MKFPFGRNESKLALNLLQVTGWGYSSLPVYRKSDHYLLNRPTKLRNMKVAYQRDVSNGSKCIEFGRPVNTSQKICAANGTYYDMGELDEICRAHHKSIRLSSLEVGHYHNRSGAARYTPAHAALVR